MARPFEGVINLDVRDSTPDWGPYEAEKAPDGAPNVLIVLYDDTGLAAWSPYGGRINMPTLDRLAANGLTYSQWHTMALCAPTRSLLPHGPSPPSERLREHLRGARPASRATTRTSRWRTRSLAEVLRRARLEHVLDRQEPQHPDRRVGDGRLASATGRCARLRSLLRVPRRARRTSGIRTSSRTTSTSSQPYLPEEGYHLSKDLADKAICLHPRLQAVRPRTSPGSPSSARARTMRRITRRRSGSTSTRARSTTATRPTASGCCRAWSSAGSCRRAPS